MTDAIEEPALGMTSVGVVADDFTSAMDAAGPFARLGHPARILHSGATVDRSGGVWAIDCDSRRQSREEAERRTADAVGNVRDAAALIKTIDSTLRGHIGPELAAAISAAGRRLTIVAPAFPNAGRITRGGRQYVDGVPVDESAFAQDARHPVRSSDLLALLSQSGIAGAELRRAGEPLPDAGVVVVDAEHEADLRALVRCAHAPADVLWVGSPGLARALADEMPPPTGPRGADPVARRLLVVVGTHHVATRRQTEALLRSLGDRALVVDADLRDLSPRIEVAVLHAPSRSGPEPLDDASAHVVADRLARRAAEFIRSGFVDGCIATGGETADAVVRALGREAIEVLGEPEPGVGLGLVHGRSRCLLATKAGGFGDDQTLLRLHNVMTLNRRFHGS